MQQSALRFRFRMLGHVAFVRATCRQICPDFYRGCYHSYLYCHTVVYHLDQNLDRFPDSFILHGVVRLSVIEWSCSKIRITLISGMEHVGTGCNACFYERFGR